MDHFSYNAEGRYCAEDVPLPRIADAVGTPFYCYSTATLLRHYQVFSASFAHAAPLVCFAVKANGSLAVLATLAQAGAGADVVSQGEILLARRAGVPASRIVFSGVGKTEAEMAFALEEGIFQFNVESEPELRALSAVASAKGATAAVAVRVNPDVASGTHAKIATGAKDTKFGVPMSEAPPLYALAAALPGIRVQGVSMHIGSQLTSLAPFAEAFSRLRMFVGTLRQAGHGIRTVDLGGGLGIPYHDEAPPLPEAYAQLVRREMDGIDAQLIFEPGRVLAGNAGILVTRVIYVKRTAGRKFIVVDAGMNDLIRPSLYEAHHDIVPVRKPEGGAAVEEADVVGPVCETGDIFAQARKLSLPAAGDLLAFRSAGAYGASMASTYNARLLPAEVMVRGSEFAVVKTRQSYEELFSRDRLPPWF
ncbi:MAG: diaminopimelate decarboxylase [Alphaproteobacteria bacterium]|nr:diaminopimelate decarboxylase [Alphaproteobacteria bacterium]